MSYISECKRRRSALPGRLVLALIATLVGSTAQSKEAKMVVESIQINAPPEYVFHAIQKQRDDQERGRRTLAFDGKNAKIDDQMENIAVYGKVHVVWNEAEMPCETIDFKMLSSDHFKSAHGRYKLTPSPDKKSTNLELETTMDSGLNIPLSEYITHFNLERNAKERLGRLKATAEADYRNGIVPKAPPNRAE